MTEGFMLPPIETQIIVRTDKIQEGMEEAGRRVDEEAKKIGGRFSNLEKTGKNLEKFGSTMTKAVTLPIAAAGIASGKFAMDYESAFAGVRKTVDATEEEYAALSEGIRNMAKEIPASAAEIAGVAEAAGQLGIEKEHLLDFTRVMIDLGNATNLSAEEGATQLSKFANVTRMSQNKFSNLGSTIVALGNNFATTEADIVAMSTRLAGTGSQVGLSEAQIMGFSAALSSVGLEAEAGGSAFSRVMTDMQLAVETNSEMLVEFADVAGMSAEDFKAAFEEDAAGAIIAFIDGLGRAEEKGTSAIKILDDMGINEVRLRDALLRSAGASDLMTEAVKLGTEAWEENNALTKEAEQRYDTTESKLEIAKNRLVDVGISIGEKLLPQLVPLVEKVGDLVTWFSELDEGTQNTIVQVGLFAAAIGPVSGTVGKLLSVGGKVGGFLSGLAGGAAKAAPAVANVGSAAAVAGGATGVGGFLSTLGGAAVAAAPFVAGAAAVAGAGYLVYKGFEQQATPAVDKLRDGVVVTGTRMQQVGDQMVEVAETTSVKVSEETKKQMQAYYDLSDGAQQKTMDLYAGLVPMTAENTAKITADVKEMANMTIAAIDDQKQRNIEDFQTLFSTSTSLTAEEKAQVLSDVETMAEDRKEKVKGMQERICELYEIIKDKGIENASEEKEELSQLYEDMAMEQIRSVAQSANEQELLINNLASSREQVTQKMVEDTIIKLNTERDEGIRLTNEKYDQMMSAAASYKTDIELSGKQMTTTQKGIYDKMVSDANQYRDETTLAYQQIRDNGIYKLNQAYSDLTQQVDIETGKQLSFFDKLFGGADENAKRINAIKYNDKSYKVVANYITNNVTRHITETGDTAATRSSHGYSYRSSGLDYVPYDGYRAHLHRGERILTKEENQRYAKKGGDVNIRIDKVENNTKEDVRHLVRRLGEEAQRQRLAKGALA
uniref:phage tail tape measure protein n=1 Tax=Ndongobacter massiliensis TaxID=1871025 RepID=UPI000931F311|nr:phage tail tape measure protein [Ndongobacter massiliensis]